MAVCHHDGDFYIKSPLQFTPAPLLCAAR